MVWLFQVGATKAKGNELFGAEKVDFNKLPPALKKAFENMKIFELPKGSPTLIETLEKGAKVVEAKPEEKREIQSIINFLKRAQKEGKTGTIVIPNEKITPEKGLKEGDAFLK